MRRLLLIPRGINYAGLFHMDGGNRKLSDFRKQRGLCSLLKFLKIGHMQYLTLTLHPFSPAGFTLEHAEYNSDKIYLRHNKNTLLPIHVVLNLWLQLALECLSISDAVKKQHVTWLQCLAMATLTLPVEVGHQIPLVVSWGPSPVQAILSPTPSLSNVTDPAHLYLPPISAVLVTLNSTLWDILLAILQFRGFLACHGPLNHQLLQVRPAVQNHCAPRSPSCHNSMTQSSSALGSPSHSINTV